MKVRIRTFAIFVALAFAPVTAAAQSDSSGFYASIGGMYVVPTDSSLSAEIDGLTIGSEIEMDGGIGLTAAVGYVASGGLRGEIELGYRNTGWDNLSGVSASDSGSTVSVDTKIPLPGDLRSISLMANGFVDFEVSWGVRPYIGAGVGIVQHEGSFDETTFDSDGDTITSPEVSESDVVTGFQLMAGLSYPMSDNTDIRLGYRYFATSDADFDGIEASYGSHSLEMGLLFRF